MVDNNEILGQILKIGQTLNAFQLQMAAELSELRAEIKKSREIENEHWLENLRRWNENDKCWKENNRRWKENEKRWKENNRRWKENKKLWEENNKKWEENKQLWIKNGIDRERDHQEIMDIFIRYDISVSKKLGDPNAEKMKKFLKCN
ncbi:putative uncharacterized protein [Clostridium sp. CAG:356]|nr:putative uncharacterized protein [Clostridium sp. CAG:356]